MLSVSAIGLQVAVYVARLSGVEDSLEVLDLGQSSFGLFEQPRSR